MVETELGGHPTGGKVVASLAKQAVRALSGGQHRRGVLQPPGRLSQPLPGLRALLSCQRGLEARSCPLPLPVCQGCGGITQRVGYVPLVRRDACGLLLLIDMHGIDPFRPNP